MARSDFDECVEQFQGALDAFFRGDAEPAKALMSHREDVTLANPFGPVARGWPEVDRTMDRAALNYRDGKATGFKVATVYSTPELGYTVWVEEFASRVGAHDEAVSGALRRTTVFRPESGSWRIPASLSVRECHVIDPHWRGMPGWRARASRHSASR